MLLKENISTIKYFYLLFLVSLFLFYAGQTLGLGVNDLDPNNDRVALSFKKDGQNRYKQFYELQLCRGGTIICSFESR